MKREDRIVWIACELGFVAFAVMAVLGWLPGGGA
jgi:hypothetical protein